MGRHMPRTAFFDRLPDQSTKSAVEALEAFCTPQTGLEAYFTGTNKGDLRVKMLKDGRPIFTAAYQTRNQVLFCRAKCPPETIIKLGIPAAVVEPTTPPEPQKSEFRLTSDEFVRHLLEIVLAGSLSYLIS